MDMIRTTEALTFQDFLRYPALRVEAGEFAFVTGRSGAGKSTYLRLLNGSIPADPGCIFYRGVPGGEDLPGVHPRPAQQD